MSTMSLEWTSPAGPAALALLAGPWRRRDAAADDPAEVFRLRVPGDGAIPVAADPLRALASASHRLLAALQPQAPGEAPARAEAELLRALAGDSAGVLTEVGPWLAELARRSGGLARVETELGERRCVVTEVSATGRLVTHVLAGAPAELLTLHGEAVAAALHTRVTLLRAAIATGELAAILAAFASPAAAGLALPLAWRFLHTLLTDHLASSDGD